MQTFNGHLKTGQSKQEFQSKDALKNQQKSSTPFELKTPQKDQKGYFTFSDRSQKSEFRQTSVKSILKNIDLSSIKPIDDSYKMRYLSLNKSKILGQQKQKNLNLNLNEINENVIKNENNIQEVKLTCQNMTQSIFKNQKDIQQLKSTCQTINQNMQKNQQDINQVKDTCQTISQNIKKNQKEIKEVKITCQTISQNIRKNQQEIKEVKNTCQDLKITCQNISQTLTQNKDDIVQLKQTCQKLSKNFLRIENQQKNMEKSLSKEIYLKNRQVINFIQLMRSQNNKKLTQFFILIFIFIMFVFILTSPSFKRKSIIKTW